MSDNTAVRLRGFRDSDEAVIRAAHEQIPRDEGLRFACELTPSMSWERFVALHDYYARGIDLPEGMVPETFFVAAVGDAIVGNASIRHRLNANLMRHGGHIGYAVVRQHRRRGYGTQILHRCIERARQDHGIRSVLVTCDDSNIASRRIIESCGGELHSIEPLQNGTLHRRYWIDERTS